MLFEEPTPSVLIVDDEPSNLQLLRAHLAPAGYSIMEAGSGLEALEMADRGPDLILLDILMPDLDGLETCSLLKENEATRDIPVIFLSALQDSKTKVAGLSMGAVDFINKPFDGAELKIRVKTQICLRRQEQQLSQYAKRLEQMVEERTRQLIHADRLATIGTLSAAVMHEVSSPLTFIGGNIELLTTFWEVARPILEKHFEENGDGVQNLAWLSKCQGYLRGIQEGSQRIWQIMESLRAYTRRDNPTMELCPLNHPIQESVKLLHHRLKKDIRVEINVDPNIQVSCNPQKISQVFVNLINNAIDAMNEGPGRISIESVEKSDTVEVHVRDNGPGISSEAAASVFDPFYTTKPRDVGTGLGLFISRKILEEHEGGLALAAPGREGAEFIISLPLKPAGPAPVMDSSILHGEEFFRPEPVMSRRPQMVDRLSTLPAQMAVPSLHGKCLKA
jgi:signal transduction histidine kinase